MLLLCHCQVELVGPILLWQLISGNYVKTTPVSSSSDGREFHLLCQPCTWIVMVIAIAIVTTRPADSEETGDHINLMQNRRYTGLSLQCNEPDEPDWYHEAVAPTGHAAVHHHLLELPEIPEQHEQSESEEGGKVPHVHPPEEDSSRQSVIMFHLDEDPVLAMLNWLDWSAMMREIAFHFGVAREMSLNVMNSRSV